MKSSPNPSVNTPSRPPRKRRRGGIGVEDFGAAAFGLMAGIVVALSIAPGISVKLLALMFALLGGSLIVLSGHRKPRRKIVMRALGITSIFIVMGIGVVFAFRALTPVPSVGQGGASISRTVDDRFRLHAGESPKLKSLLQSLAVQVDTRGDLSDADVAALNKLKIRLTDKEFADAVLAVLDLAARDRADERAGKPARLRDDFRRDLEAVFGEPAAAAAGGGG